MKTDPSAIIGRLNPVCHKALDAAARLSVAQTHFSLEVEHFLRTLTEVPDSDFGLILRHIEIDPVTLAEQLDRGMERFKRGSSRNAPPFAPQLIELLEEAWLLASVDLGSESIRSGAVLMAVLDPDRFGNVLLQSCPILVKNVSTDSLRRDLRELVAASAEEDARYRRTATPRGSAAHAAGPASETGALDRFTIDLTAEAIEGKIDPIRGRSREIRQVVDILTRRRQNNPILVGDAGVGKTAIVEGFAREVAARSVPSSLQDVQVRILDLGLLQAGAGVKGEFEERLKSVIDEVKHAAPPVILFIDEAHTLVGAGGAAGQGDAANLLKPALARGELRTIAATTWSEYKKYFEKDPALTRRFQLVRVDEPEIDVAVDMLRGIAANLAEHHQVRILDEAVRDAVHLSDRYLSERRLPDKAISVLDTACARVALGRDAKPPPIEEIDRLIQPKELELEVLQRESELVDGHAKTIARLESEIAELAEERSGLAARWDEELALVRKVDELEAELGDARETGAAEKAAKLSKRIARLRKQCEKLQGAEPMVPLVVDSRVVTAVIAGWTGIPVGQMMIDEIRGVLALEERMAERLIGQPHALEAICKRISTSRAELEDPRKPQGVFLLVGPSGVGKTETAVTLTDILYGGSRNMVTLNMSEFQEGHSVATLKGSPPGYVGYGEGGVLTEAVRRRPYSVVLLDEAEKAHPDVMELFYQVFDKGVLEDGEGVPVDFKNTIILLTSNLGSDAIFELCDAAGGKRPEPEAVLAAVRPVLLEHFRPALLGRLALVPYYPLAEEQIQRIVELKLDEVRKRVAEHHLATLEYDDEVVAAIAARCTDTDTGARNIDFILTQTLLPELSAELLERMVAGRDFATVRITQGEAGRFAYEIAD